MSRPVAIVAAMRSEVAPLLRQAKLRTTGETEIYELPSALVVIGGIGRDAGRRAAEIAASQAQPGLLVSAGLAGALTPSLKAGDVVHVSTVVDEASGKHFATEHFSNDQQDAVLVSALHVAGKNDKQRLALTHGASLVDMEAAAVARVAEEHGVSFCAVKAISDELSFAMPPVNQFVDAQGQFHALGLAAYVAVRPRWWAPTATLARNSALASRNLCAALEHLMSQHTLDMAGERGTRS